MPASYLSAQETSTVHGFFQQIRSADPSMEQPADIKLTRDDKPERKFFENPLTWYLGV